MDATILNDAIKTPRKRKTVEHEIEKIMDGLGKLSDLENLNSFSNDDDFQRENENLDQLVASFSESLEKLAELETLKSRRRTARSPGRFSSLNYENRFEKWEDLEDNWAENQPDDQGGGQSCVYLDKNGKYDDFWCGTKQLTYFCQKKPADFYHIYHQVCLKLFAGPGLYFNLGLLALRSPSGPFSVFAQKVIFICHPILIFSRSSQTPSTWPYSTISAKKSRANFSQRATKRARVALASSPTPKAG